MFQTRIKNRPIILKFVRYKDRKQYLPTKREKGKGITITESSTRIRMSEFNDARNKFGYRSVWTTDRKIMYKVKCDAKANLIDLLARSGCVTEKQELFFILIALFYFCLFEGFFMKHLKSVSYFVFLILFIGIIHLIKTIFIKIQFYHLISLNITILLFKNCKSRLQQNINVNLPIESFNNKLC